MQQPDLFDHPGIHTEPLAFHDALPRSATIQERFLDFHRRNPWVYDSLVKLAADMVVRGRKKLGISMLWEVLRWSYYRQTADPTSDFKLNNYYRSRYVRLMIADNPEWQHYFELRELTRP